MSKFNEIYWWQHPRVVAVGDFVEGLFDVKCYRGFDDATSKNTFSIKGYRAAALRWIEVQREMLGKLEVKVKALPLDPRGKMRVEVKVDV